MSSNTLVRLHVPKNTVERGIEALYSNAGARERCLMHTSLWHLAPCLGSWVTITRAMVAWFELSLVYDGESIAHQLP